MAILCWAAKNSLRDTAAIIQTQRPPEDHQIVGPPRPRGEQAIGPDGPTQRPASVDEIQKVLFLRTMPTYIRDIVSP
jgi:hypothetical protein